MKKKKNNEMDFNKSTLEENLTNKSTRKLIKFLEKSFPSQQKSSDIEDKIKAIRCLKKDFILYAIARLEKICYISDLRQSIIVVGFFVTTISLIFRESGIFKRLFQLNLDYGWMFVIFALLLFFLMYMAYKDRKRYIVSLHFKELLIQIKEDMKKK
ncbi:hypothetical protein [Bacillus xiamenensis]|uniref:hypothetical protein n=1 Tax=Bacillus xiamenensis TaxID=1178537 RepID=UPI00028D96F5|nr:hypothetical protein [Bacillus xiamenensis]EKF35060.1 hypothetical protein BA1_11989 [Bacillus xiamenensis]